jgi:hypothetical protein
MTFELAKKVADAVLYEGYVLYPYRASSVKNQVRFQFGVVVPRGYAEGAGSEPWSMQTECLVEPRGAPTLTVKVRFLHVQARRLEEAVDGDFRPAERLEVGGKSFVPWDEGVERELDLEAVPLRPGLERTLPIAISAGIDAEAVRGQGERAAGRILRERAALHGAVRLSVEAAGEFLKVRVRIENSSPWSGGVAATRDEAVRRSLVGTHTLLAVRGGAFVSLLDPPAEAADFAASCRNEHTYPVLLGPEGARDEMLSSPIILYDHPAVAPESPGDLCDATEIDEILTLRVMTLTDAEKVEARATDERARAIIERSDAIPPEVFERLHGAVRAVAAGQAPPEAPWASEFEAFLNPPGTVPPADAAVEVAGVRIQKGARVRLRPRRRADAMDAFLEGHVGRVEAVYLDLEDRTYVAVTVEDDPAAELHSWFGRFFYFDPSEIEPVEPEASAP